MLPYWGSFDSKSFAIHYTVSTCTVHDTRKKKKKITFKTHVNILFQQKISLSAGLTNPDNAVVDWNHPCMCILKWTKIDQMGHFCVELACSPASFYHPKTCWSECAWLFVFLLALWWTDDQCLLLNCPPTTPTPNLYYCIKWVVKMHGWMDQ